MRTIRKPYDEAENIRIDRLTAIDFTNDPGRTIQEPTEDADINVLMKRMGVKDGSILPYFHDPRALYGDFSEMPSDPTEAAEMLREGQIAFMKLPGAVRQRFNNPEELFQFMNDDSNYEEAVKLGLLAKKEDVKPDPVLEELRKLNTNFKDPAKDGAK